jgi:hypothetical protein
MIGLWWDYVVAGVTLLGAALFSVWLIGYITRKGF